MKQFTFQSRLTLLYLLPILYIRFFHFLNLSLPVAYINFSDSDVMAHKLLSHQMAAEHHVEPVRFGRENVSV